jgi:hypothetical protein
MRWLFCGNEEVVPLKISIDELQLLLMDGEARFTEEV